MTPGFIIDDFSISICYARRNLPNSNGMNTSGLKNAASMALAAAQWTNQKEVSSTNEQQQIIKQLIVQSTSTIEQTNLLLSNTPNIQITIPLSAPGKYTN